MTTNVLLSYVRENSVPHIWMQDGKKAIALSSSRTICAFITYCYDVLVQKNVGKTRTRSEKYKQNFVGKT